MAGWIEELATTGVALLAGAPLCEQTTFRVGGPCDALLFPGTCDELVSALRVLGRYQVPCIVVGRGSDLIIRDGGFRGAVIKTTRLTAPLQVVEGSLVAAAGVNLSRLAHFSARHGLTGLEFAAGIPGTVGGGLYMNAGAHGGELGPLAERVVTASAAGLVTWERAELNFRYRMSPFREQRLVVVQAEFALAPGDPQASAALMRRLLAERNRRQPVSWPNAGSVFKNPPGDSAGRLIEAVGGKGRRAGGAQISDLHANFIINLGGATATDVVDLMDWAQAAVWTRFGIALEPEVQVVGEPSPGRADSPRQ